MSLSQFPGNHLSRIEDHSYVAFDVLHAAWPLTNTQDISARSPVSQPDSMPSRQSLDSRVFRQPSHPRSAVNGGHFERPPKTDEEEAFEDVGLNDDPKPKKKSIFSRFADSSADGQTAPADSDKALSWAILMAFVFRVGRED